MKHEGKAHQGRSKKLRKYSVTTSNSENRSERIKDENHP
jgi:hypothetical protein